MFQVHTQPDITIPVGETEVLRIESSSDMALFFENHHATNTLTYKVEKSSDGGGTWSELVASTTLGPALFVDITLTGATMYRIMASGNLTASALVVGRTTFQTDNRLAIRSA